MKMKFSIKATLFLLLHLVSAVPLGQRAASPCDAQEKPHHVILYADDSLHGTSETFDLASECCIRLDESFNHNVSSFNTGDSECTFYSSNQCTESGRINIWPGGWQNMTGVNEGHDTAVPPRPLPWNDQFSSFKCIARVGVAPAPPATTLAPNPQSGATIYAPLIPKPACSVAEKPHTVSFYADDDYHGYNATLTFPTDCCVDLNDIAETKGKVSSLDTRDSYCKFYSSADCTESGARNVWPGGWMQLSGRRDGHVIGENGTVVMNANHTAVMKPWNDQIQSANCLPGDR